MPDKRETIMAALFTALQGVHGEGAAAVPYIDRNGDTALDVEERPAIRMWDGDEVSDSGPPRPANRNASIRVAAQPCVALYVEGSGSAAATAANALLGRVRTAIWTNAALQAAIGVDPVISQESLVLDIAPATKTQASILMHLNIPYQFNPASP